MASYSASRASASGSAGEVAALANPESSDGATGKISGGVSSLFNLNLPAPERPAADPPQYEIKPNGYRV